MIHAIRRLFEKPELWLVRCVLLASTIAVIYYSAEKAKDKPTQIILICLGLAAVGFHYIGAKKACAAWFDRSLARVMAWTLVIIGAVLWEVNGQLGVGSQNQVNLTQARLTSHNSSQIAQRQLKAAEDHEATLTGEQAWKADVKPANSYDADIARAKAHRFYTLTNSCTETKGSQTRTFCDAYRKAESDQAIAVRKEQLAGMIKEASVRVDEARKAVSGAGVTTSGDRADFKNMHRLTGLSSDDLELGQSLLLVLVMALFLTVAGWLIKAEEFEGKPRKPWINGAYWKAIFMGDREMFPAPAKVADKEATAALVPAQTAKPSNSINLTVHEAKKDDWLQKLLADPGMQKLLNGNMKAA